MTKIVFCLTVLICSFNLHAEENKGKGRVSGKVVDEANSEPLEFTPVALLTLDSMVVNGGLTDESGMFLIEDVQDGDYLLKIDFIGYKSQFQSLTFNSDNRIHDLGEIKLSPATELGDVKVTGETSGFRTEIDKKVYDPSKNPVNAGGTALDVMRNVPSIEVDPDDIISLRGDQNVNILIDGRPVAMSVSQFLKQLPASAIQEIEIITNPSAKYDPEGTSGIINVKLKKNTTSGFNGSANLAFGYGEYAKTNGSISLNYLSEKVNVSSSLSLFNGKFGYGGDLDRTIFGDTTVNLSSVDYGHRGNFSPSATLGLDYFLNDKNTLYINGTYNYSDRFGRRTIDYEFRENDSLIATSKRQGAVEIIAPSYQLNGGWQKKFAKKDHTFDLDMRFADSESPVDEDLEEVFYDGMGVQQNNSARQKTNQGLNSKLFNLQANYVNPITDSMKLEAGFHFTGKYILQEFYSETFNYTSDAFVPDVSLNNEFDYSQDVYAGYVTLARQFKSVGVKAGLRAEQTNTLSELVTTNETFRNDYFELFPSAHISYGKTPFSQWQLSYSRRINRPGTEEINPFTTYDDPYTFQRGNPFLRPEFIHVFEGSHALIKEKFTLNSTLYYRLIKDQKRRYLDLLPNGITQISYDNLSSSQLKGAELIATYTFAKIRTALTLNYWHNAVDDPDAVSGNLSNQNHGWSANMNASRRFGRWMVQLSGNYRGKMKVIQGTIKPAGGIDLAARKMLLGRKMSVGLRVQDIFKTRNFTFEGDGLDGYTFTSGRIWESRQYWVSLTYNFGKPVKGKQRKQISTEGSGDDRSAGGM